MNLVLSKDKPESYKAELEMLNEVHKTKMDHLTRSEEEYDL